MTIPTDFSNALHAIDTYKQSRSHAPRILSSIVWIERRVQRLAAQAARLMQINDMLSIRHGVSSSFDDKTNTLTVTAFGISQSLVLRRADPNIPISVAGQSYFSGYDADHDAPFDDPQNNELRASLADEIEAFYAHAHRVQKRVQNILQLKHNGECKEIAIVRVKILEHPDDSVTNSFGYGSGGPTISPMKRGKSTFHDRGLVHNADAFDQFLTKVFNQASHK